MKNSFDFITCVKCGEKLTETGALLFSYPNEHDMVFKYHICRKCWHNKLLTWIDE